MGLARGVQATIVVPLVHAGTGLLYGVAATVTVSKDGSAFAASTNAASSAADFGCTIVLTATEMTADVVTLKITDATVLPRVVTITTDAALVAANVTQISGDATAADNAEAFFDGTGYAGTNNTIPTVGTVTNPVTAGTVSDKTGYSLAAAYDAAKLAASQASVNAIPTTPLLAANYTAPDNASVAAILEDTGTTIPAAIADLPTDGDVQTAAVAALTAYAPSKAGDAMALTAGERTTLVSAIWAAGTRTLTSLGTLLDGIPAAVWGHATRILTAFGFTPEPDAATVAKLDAIKGTTDRLGSVTVTVRSNVTPGGTIRLNVGDDHTLAMANAITVTVDDENHTLGLDSAASVLLRAPGLSLEAVDVSVVTDGYTVTWEASRAETRRLARGTYTYEIEQVNPSGERATRVRGVLAVSADV